jgi:hypothetical protein
MSDWRRGSQIDGRRAADLPLIQFDRLLPQRLETELRRLTIPLAGPADTGPAWNGEGGWRLRHSPVSSRLMAGQSFAFIDRLAGVCRLSIDSTVAQCLNRRLRCLREWRNGHQSLR